MLMDHVFVFGARSWTICSNSPKSKLEDLFCLDLYQLR